MEPLGSERHTWEDPARVKLLGRRFIKRCDMAGAARVSAGAREATDSTRASGTCAGRRQWDQGSERHRAVTMTGAATAADVTVYSVK
jgi:hypothetical protein